MAFGRVSTTTAITSIASSFDKRFSLYNFLETKLSTHECGKPRDMPSSILPQLAPLCDLEV
jgi:hypothetical protein